MLSEKQEWPIYFVATVESCEKTENGLKFIVSEASRKYNDEANALCKKFNKLNLMWRGKKAQCSSIEYTPGSRVLFRSLLYPIYLQAFPGAYDFRKQQYFKGISARGFILKPPKIIEKADLSSFKIFIEQIRQKIDRKIEEYLSKDTASVLKALTTGNTAGISKETRSHFVNSGTAHLLSISGLHIGIIGFFIFWLFRIIFCCFFRVSMYYDTKKIAAVMSWVVTLIYLYISGCSVPSCRAFIMHTLIIVAILLNRMPLTMRSVAIAATAIMLCTPEVVLYMAHYDSA
jgi:competence protein ComEC